MRSEQGWKLLLLCCAGLLIFGLGFFLGRSSGDTVIYESQVAVIESSPQTVPAEPAVTAPTEKININTASQAQLETLPEIGPALAQRIIEYRQTNGPYRTIDQIKDVKGIGEATFAAFADQITVGGEP